MNHDRNLKKSIVHDYVLVVCITILTLTAGDSLRKFYNCPILKMKRARSGNRPRQRPFLQLGIGAPENFMKLAFIEALPKTFYNCPFQPQLPTKISHAP